MATVLGAEAFTREHHAKGGSLFIRDPKTGHGTTTTPASLQYMRERGRPMAGDPALREQQPALFSADEIKNPPHHSLSPHQFAAQHDVWWHGRYGEDLPSDSYKEGHEHFPDHDPGWGDEDDGDGYDMGYDEKSGYQGIHFGTRKAAEDRLTALGPGRPQTDDESMERHWTGESERVPGRMFPVTLEKERFGPKINRDVGHDWREHMGYDEPVGHGVLYQNEAEDRASISAAVPERYGRRGAFFKTWNDHVTEAHDAGVDVHPMLLHAAQRGAEHTGEDWVHPDEHKHALTTPGAPEQTPLFQAYGLTRAGAKAKYLDRDYKDTLGPNIKVPSHTIKRRQY